jgi:hypothetical protein
MKNNQTIPRKPDDVDKAYLAGLIAGDGSIHVSKQPQKNRKFRPYYQISVCVEMVAQEEIQWIVDTFGGQMTVRNRDKYHRRESYRYKVNGEKAIELLKLVYPFLKHKKRQAALAFKLREVVKQTLYQRHPERLHLREELYNEINALNLRPRRTRDSVETARAAFAHSEEMIQSELTSDGEKIMSATA